MERAATLTSTSDFLFIDSDSEPSVSPYTLATSLRILGVTFDSQFFSNQHIQYLIARAKLSHSVRRRVAGGT